MHPCDQIESGMPVPPPFGFVTISALPSPVTELDATNGTSGGAVITRNEAVVALSTACAFSVSTVVVAATRRDCDTRVIANNPNPVAGSLYDWPGCGQFPELVAQLLVWQVLVAVKRQSNALTS